MGREDLLKLCHFYKDEKDCPQDFIGHIEEKLWGFEEVACHIMELPAFKTTGNPRFDFDNTIAMLAAKWCPYNCLEILEVYFQHSPVYKEQILKALF